MPALLGPISEQRLALVHPTLSHLIHQLAQQMSEIIGVTQGLRTDDEQLALFAQGRQLLDNVNALREKVNWAPITATANRKRVTDALPGYSWHSFGLAVDVVPFEASGQPDWDETHPVWAELVQRGTALGMVDGIHWGDEPHFQWTCQYPVTPNDEVRELFKQGGLKAIWDSLIT